MTIGWAGRGGRRALTIFGLTLLVALGPFVLLAAAPVGAAAEVCFPEANGKCIGGRFLEYWQANGGLAQQGYPITDVFMEVNQADGKSYQTQYFERARFELHPENAAPYDVLLGLLGREQLMVKYPDGAPAGVPAETGCTDTGIPGTKCINRRFGQYFLGNGGVAQHGYAITDAFNEVSPTNGQTYLVQYFERARFEYHPENADIRYQILLGLLGREQYLAKDPAELRFVNSYSDDFGDTTRWPTFQEEQRSASYKDGRYVLTAAGSTLKKIGIDNPVSRPGVPLPGGGFRALPDMRLGVRATPLSAGGSAYGLSCRTQGSGARYVGVVYMLFAQAGPSYAARIRKYNSTEGFEQLVERQLPAGVVALNQTATLQFTCAGPNLTLAVNGTIVARAQDYSLVDGGFGLEATHVTSGGGAGAASPLAVAYDDLTVDSWR